MNYQLKSISKAGIAEALAKVELYRYLNEPEESESICRDILAVDPQQQLALRLLGLSITDQFTGGVSDRSCSPLCRIVTSCPCSTSDSTIGMPLGPVPPIIRMRIIGARSHPVWVRGSGASNARGRTANSERYDPSRCDTRCSRRSRPYLALHRRR